MGIKTVTEVKQWLQSGFTVYDVKLWKPIVTIPTNALLWKNNGFSNPSDIEEWIKKGFTPISAKKELEEQRQQAMQEENEKQQKVIDKKRQEKLYQLLLKILFGGLVLIVMYGFYLGFTNKAVFYADIKDVFISFVPFVLLIILSIISVVFEFGNWFNYMIFIVISIAIVIELKRSYTYNGTYVQAIPVTVSKIAFSILSIMGVFGYLDSKNKDARTTSGYTDGKNTWVFLIILGIFSWITIRLINRDRVENK